MIPAPITTQSGSNLRSNVPNIFTLRTGPDVGTSDNTSSPHDNTVINSLLKLTSLKCENGFQTFSSLTTRTLPGKLGFSISRQKIKVLRKIIAKFCVSVI